MAKRAKSKKSMSRRARATPPAPATPPATPPPDTPPPESTPTDISTATPNRQLGNILAPLGSQWKIRLDNDITWDDLIRWAKLLHAQCRDAERELYRVKGQLSAERSRRRAAEVQLKGGSDK